MASNDTTPADTAKQKCGLTLLALPRELRDFIYEYYIRLSGPDGYVYDFEANKLRTSDKKPIDLSLMYTCRQVACEMRGMALRIQTVTFTTLYSEDLRPRAGRFCYYLCEMLPIRILRDLVPRMSDEMRREVTQRFGTDILYFLTHEPDAFDLDGTLDGLQWREPQYTFYTAKTTVFRIAMADARLRDHVMAQLPPTASVNNVLKAIEMAENPWRIPTVAELDILALVTGVTVPEYERPDAWHSHFDWRHHPWKTWEDMPGRYRFSAVSAAIHFLGSMPASTRLDMRNLVVHEDRFSVPWPESHARGLAPFCAENPLLRIERRVSLWWTVWMANLRGNRVWHYCSIVQWPTTLSADLSEFTYLVAVWMTEAANSEIPNQVTLLLDGEVNALQASDIFCGILHRDVAWQVLADRLFRPASAPSIAALGRPEPSTVRKSDFGLIQNEYYLYDAFPMLLRNMCKAYDPSLPISSDNSARVRCNFFPGEPWDECRVTALIEENKDDIDTTHGWVYGFERKLSERAKGRFRHPCPLPVNRHGDRSLKSLCTCSIEDGTTDGEINKGPASVEDAPDYSLNLLFDLE